MEAKIEQGLRVLTKKDEELAEHQAMEDKVKENYEVEVNNYNEELGKLKSENNS
jgi:hypothetical protein